MFPSFRCANDCKTRSCISFAINETKRIFNKSVRNFDIPRYIHISWQLLAPARGRRNRQGAMNRLGASLERSRPSSVTSSWWFFLPRFLSGLPLSSLFSPLPRRRSTYPFLFHPLSTFPSFSFLPSFTPSSLSSYLPPSFSCFLPLHLLSLGDARAHFTSQLCLLGRSYLTAV